MTSTSDESITPEQRVIDPSLLQPGVRIKLYTPHRSEVFTRTGEILFFGTSRSDSMIGARLGAVYVDDERLELATELRVALAGLDRGDEIPAIPPFALFIPLRDLGMGEDGWFPGVSYVEIIAKA